MSQFTPPEPLPLDLIGAVEAAKLARCTGAAVRKWVRLGRIRGWRRGCRTFVSRAEIESLFVAVADPKQPARPKWVDSYLSEQGIV